MKKTKSLKDDELRPEYDLNTLRVRKVGPGRKLANGAPHRLAGATRTTPPGTPENPSKLV